MAYCTNCGSEIEENAVVCLKCGCSINNTKNAVVEDVTNPLYVVLSVLFPVVGLVLYIMNKEQTPKSAKNYGIAALISFAVSLIVSIVAVILFVVFFVNISTSF